MKHITSLILFIALSWYAAVAQSGSVAINSDGSVADNTAILDLKSDSKGLLIPRLTTAQRNNIPAPATDLLVYQTGIPEGFYYNKGTPYDPYWILLGATGPQGPQGMPGTTGIVQSYYVAGTTAYPSSVMSFISPTITITIAAGQSVYVNASRALGGYAPANELGIHPASQSIAAGSPINTLGLGMYGLQVPSNTRITFSVNGVFKNLPAGTYKFGMAGITPSPNWTNSEWGYTSALVF